MSNTTTTGTAKRKALIIGCGIAGPVLAMFLRLPQPPRQGPREAPGDDDPDQAWPAQQGALGGGDRRGVTVEFGKRLKDVEITRQRTVVARFEDGSEARGDFLAGCDGIHSRTRQAIMPDAPEPVYTGVIDSGAFTRSPSVPLSDGVMRMTFGTKGFFGYQVVPSGEIYWFQNFQQPTEPDRKKLEAIPNHEWRQKLLEMHRDDHMPIAEIIRSTESTIGWWPIYDMPSMSTWHKGPVCPVGDATGNHPE